MWIERRLESDMSLTVFHFFSLVWMLLPTSQVHGKIPLYLIRLRELLQRQRAFEQVQNTRLKTLEEASTSFASQLFPLQLSVDNHSNVILSPLGAFASMAMTLSGSDGMTKMEVRQLLRMPNITGVHTTIQHAFRTFHNDDTSIGNDPAADDEGFASDATSEDFPEDMDREYAKIVEIAKNDLAVDKSISYTTGSSNILSGIGISLATVGSSSDVDNKRQLSEDDVRPRVTARFANGLFHSDDVAMTQLFSNRLAELYGAPPMAMEPSDPASSVNLWVDATTLGTVPQMLDAPLDPGNSSLFLVSAVFFHGAWEDEFDARKTVPVDFSTDVGDTVRIDTMHRIGNYSVKTPDDLGSKILELPYAGGNYSLFVFLPLPGHDLSQLAERLRSADIPILLRDMPPPTLTLVLLPKFRVSQRQSLKLSMETLGARRLFKPWQAQLQRMTGEEKSRLHVQDVIQYAALHVDEGGSLLRDGDAPHDTSSHSSTLDSTPTTPFDVGDEEQYPETDDDDYSDYEDDEIEEDYDDTEDGVDGDINDFIVDRPFLFVLLDKRFQLVLLMGRVATPIP